MGQQASQANNNMEQEAFSIPFWEYNREAHGWIQKQPDKYYQKNHWDGFRVLTYNIWFSDKYQPMRFKGLCDILNRSDAHIIGLQESSYFSIYNNSLTICLVTKDILQQLLAQPFIQQRYCISDVDGRTFNGWYGVVLLIDTRLHISHLNLIDFPQSFMGRRLIIAEINLDQNETLRIGTVHLESLNSAEERQRQLNICRKIFNRSPATCILMGDFNFNAHGQENIRQFRTLPGWIDVWVNLMGIDNPGYTFDSGTNAMTRANSDATDRARIDRIILHSQTIIPTNIDILGMKSIGNEEHLPIFPSDHYGLTAVFQKKK
jgi:endonuclease/exonuclease/phosphatase family metal-dependent hydrolase